MPQSGAPAEAWLAGTQTLDWRAAGAQVVLAGRVQCREAELDSPSATNTVTIHIEVVLIYVACD